MQSATENQDQIIPLIIIYWHTHLTTNDKSRLVKIVKKQLKN